MAFHELQNNFKKSFGGSQKIRKKVLNVREKSGNYFLANAVHTIHLKPELLPPLKKPDKPSKNLIFSDVIAIAGNRRASGSVSLKNLAKLCAKKSDPQNAAKLQDQIAFKRVLLGKNPFKTVIILAVDTYLKKSGNLIGKKSIGARLRLRIDHLLSQEKHRDSDFI